ncbi:MAG: ferredoxin--NADP reductase [Nevskiaceae bacterium]|nr:MAG: ferredoxin--NADP reductase [Nevskiaceae bacterium]
MSRVQYHRLKIREVVEETADARSILFDVPEALQAQFRYRPGQFLTLHVPLAARPLPRCYSLSSTPAFDEPLRVTVKRVVDGRGSNWLCDHLKAGDTLDVAAPGGIFTPKNLDEDFLMFAGGSGITPVLSIIRTVLASGNGSIRLIYANRDERSVIFGSLLAKLSREHPKRLQVIHWLDSVQGIPSQAQISALGRGFEHAECFICGPSLFMDATAAAAAHDLGMPHARIHVERFVSLPEDADEAADAAPAADAGRVEIEVTLDGETRTVEGREGQLIIDAMEAAGMQPPYSCRAGACAACMCKLEEGNVELRHNQVLDKNDLDQGWILGCQAVPLSSRIRVSYPS